MTDSWDVFKCKTYRFVATITVTASKKYVLNVVFKDDYCVFYEVYASLLEALYSISIITQIDARLCYNPRLVTTSAGVTLVNPIKDMNELIHLYEDYFKEV